MRDSLCTQGIYEHMEVDLKIMTFKAESGSDEAEEGKRDQIIESFVNHAKELMESH